MKLDISDRKGVFYWQTDRKMAVEDFERIFLKRQSITDDEIIRVLKEGITFTPVTSLEIETPDQNVISGNVNIVRKIVINGKKYHARLHPKAVKNGYFFVEKVAWQEALKRDLPVPEPLDVHESTHDDDMDFIISCILDGDTLDNFLKNNSGNADENLEHDILFKAGSLLAKVHTIKVEGFGAFNNEVAKNENKLVGLHATYKDFIWTGLEENLERLIHLKIIDSETSASLRKIYEENNFEPLDGPRLIHNDYADWNMLTDGSDITAILDWDECHAGDPIADLACWSTFFKIERFEHFLKGYTSIATLPDDYHMRFEFYRLRYFISKMALRAKRYIVDKDPAIKAKMDIGMGAFKKGIEIFS